MADFQFPIQPIRQADQPPPLQQPTFGLGDLAPIYEAFTNIQQKKQQLETEAVKNLTQQINAIGELSLARQKEAFQEKHLESMLPFDQELKKQEAAKAASEARQVSEESLMKGLSLLGASDESVRKLSGMGPLSQPMAEMMLRGLAEEKSRQAALATHEIPIFDQETSVPVGKEIQNGMGIPIKRIDIPDAQVRVKEVRDLNNFMETVDHMDSLYQKVRSGIGGTGVIAGNIKSVVGRVTGNAARELAILGRSSAGLFAQFLDKVPGSRMGLKLAGLTEGARLGPDTPQEIEKNLVNYYKQIAQKRIKMLRSPITSNVPARQEGIAETAGLDIEKIRAAIQGR